MASDREGEGAVRADAPLCRICAGPTVPHLRRNSYEVVRCGDCGFMFALMPERYDAASIYRNDVYFTSEGECGIANYDGLWRRRLTPFYLPRLGRIEGLQKPASLLDIGCAAGYFMKAAQDHGWRVAGIELSAAMRHRAAELTGQRVFESIDQAVASGERFECVTMFEVIEHLSDPLGTMREVAKLLVPNGLLALSTPNCECPGAEAGLPINVWFDPPEHISYFSIKTLPECLGRAGFRTIALEGLEHYCKALAGDTAFPPWLTAILRPIRKGRRLRPGGFIGKILENAYRGRLDLYQRRSPADLPRTDVLELYARKTA